MRVVNGLECATFGTYQGRMYSHKQKRFFFLMRIVVTLCSFPNKQRGIIGLGGFRYEDRFRKNLRYE
jgi:hypothetical protein